MSNLKSRHLAALAFVGWYLMMPPDSSQDSLTMSIPTFRSRRWIVVTSYDTEDNCEKVLTDIQNSEQDPIDARQDGQAQAPPEK